MHSRLTSLKHDLQQMRHMKITFSVLFWKLALRISVSQAVNNLQRALCC